MNKAASEAFPRQFRLTRTDEYSSVFGFRKAIRGQWLMLHFQPAAAATGARLGIVVGKKQLRRAVDRNRVKRVLREQFRCRRSALPAYDLVARLAVKPAPLDARQLAADFVQLLGRLRPRQTTNPVPCSVVSS